MKPVQQIFWSDSTPVRVTYVPDHGINAETGEVVGDVFYPRREDQFPFIDHAEYRRMYTQRGWNLKIVRQFLTDVTEDTDDTEEEIELFNEWLHSL